MSSQDCVLGTTFPRSGAGAGRGTGAGAGAGAGADSGSDTAGSDGVTYSSDATGAGSDTPSLALMVTLLELGSNCVPPAGLVKITIPAGWPLWTYSTV
jgi:hypothetical protein